MPGAAVVWTVAGAGGRLEQVPGITDSRGEVSVVWVLGTRAADAQVLTAQVAIGKHKATATVTAIAKPVEVSSIAFTAHDTTQVKFGIATPLAIQATDPFGNKFIPSATRFISLDTTLCSIDSLGSVRARKRGLARVVALAGSAADTAWVHSTQVVQAIVATPDTLKFHSLGQTASLAVHLIDDQGLSVKDSLPADSVVVDTVVKVQVGATYTIRSVANGMTPVILRAGLVVQTVEVVVHQRVASVKLFVGRVSLDALGDTVQLRSTVSDSLGAPLTNQVLGYSADDTSVVTVGPNGLVTSKGNGATWIHAKAWNGVADSVQVVVAQQVARVVSKHDSIVFDALQAAAPVDATPLDRLGAPVAGAALIYGTTARSIATVDANGNVRAIANGSTVVVASYGADTASVVVRVAQRPVRILVPTDTVRFVALGDTQAIRSTAVDSLGSVVTNMVVSLRVTDTTVADQVDSLTLRSRSNGSTAATLTVGGIAKQVMIGVNQVPVTMTAAVSFGTPVLTLPVGAQIPMSCQALDRNGFVIPQDPALVGTVRGTVTGTRCGDVRVQQSGYDTLSFALGSTRARVPVIVATRPDSVGVLAVAHPLTTAPRDSFVGEDLTNPLILALRPLVADILAAYADPPTNLGRARAIRDWVARTAIHPDPSVHQNGSTGNLSVLPLGKTWADVNSVFSPAKVDEDRLWWGEQYYDGYAMLDRLLGTLDRTTGLRGDDGMMEHVAGVRYRIRDIQAFRYLLCSYQAVVANALWAAAGLHALRASTLGHDPAAVFVPEFGWVYEDPTFDEEYLLDGAGEPLSPTDLLTLSTNGEVPRLKPNKLMGPTFDPEIYVGGWTYLNTNPQGMVIMGAQLYNRVVGVGGGWTGRYVQIDVPRLATAGTPYDDPSEYDPVAATVAFPSLGVFVGQPRVEDSVYTVGLSSTFPNHDHFERRTSGGPWGRVTALDVLPLGACRVEYRSVDAVGSISASAVLDVWVPRAQAFVQSGDASATRKQAQYCS
jgi:hypothetical protein